ncbi:TcpE family [Mycobacterium tuberculosis]|nr:TcpE family [Mycobacterium tuberculosis]
MKVLRTYNQVFQIEKTVYSVEGIRLPFPVTYRQAGFFVGTIALMALLNIFPPTSLVMDSIPILDTYLVKFIGIPALSAWLLTKKSRMMDGKAPHRFLWRWGEYQLSPRRFRRYQEIEEPRGGKWKFEGVAAYRTTEAKR